MTLKGTVTMTFDGEMAAAHPDECKRLLLEELAAKGMSLVGEIRLTRHMRGGAMYADAIADVSNG